MVRKASAAQIEPKIPKIAFIRGMELVLGFVINSTPTNPIIVARLTKRLGLLRVKKERKTTKIGEACKKAVAIPSGIVAKL